MDYFDFFLRVFVLLGQHSQDGYPYVLMPSHGRLMGGIFKGPVNMSGSLNYLTLCDMGLTWLFNAR